MPAAPQTNIARDSAVAAAAGYIGGTVMEQFNMQAFQRLEPVEDRQREQEVRPGPPYVVTAKKMAAALGIELEDDKAQKAGMALHYLLPIYWVPTYMSLRRTADMRPLTAGLLSGAAMSLIVDGGMTAALASAPPTSSTRRPPTCARLPPTSSSASRSPRWSRAHGACWSATDVGLSLPSGGRDGERLEPEGQHSAQRRRDGRGSTDDRLPEAATPAEGRASRGRARRE